MSSMDQASQKLNAQLECPFTWDMSEYPTDILNYDLDYDEMFVPEITFMRYIMFSYNNSMQLEYLKAEEKLKKAEEIILNLNGLAREVAEHIFSSTKVNLLIKTEKLNDKVENILQKIKSIKGDMYNSQLNKFKSYAWSFANESCSAIKIAIEFAKLSIEQDPKSAISHFLLAKNLRCLRRMIDSVHSIPKEKEVYHFARAYELSKNPQFGLFAAQAYKESWDSKNAFKIFKYIYDMNLENASIQMRLALAFTQMYQLTFAKKCLDYVESVIPDDSMFLHYKGLFFMKKKQYQEAAPYLKKAGLSKNYGADITYAKCMRKSGKKFDATAYFINILEKYSDCQNPRKQQIYLHIAFSFFRIKRDIREAIKYFLLAFELEAEGDILKNYLNPLDNEAINVYRFLKKDVLPKVKHYCESKVISLSEETISASAKLEGYLEKYYKI